MFAHLDPKAIIVTTKSLEKDEALTLLVLKVCEVFDIKDPDAILSGVIERETKLSTGIGLEVAVPHCMSKQVKHVVMAAMLATTGIEYNSVDGLPVKLIFLIISPESEITGHLASLSAISHATSDETIRSDLLRSLTPESLYSKLGKLH